MKNFKEVINEAKKLYAIVSDEEGIDSVYTNKKAALVGAKDVASEFGTTIEVIEFEDGGSVQGGGRVISKVRP